MTRRPRIGITAYDTIASWTYWRDVPAALVPGAYVEAVRAVGGLDDTVVNYNERSGRGTGFKFREYTPDALVRTVQRALKLFGHRKEWRALQLAGMRQDFSWDASARGQ